MRKMLSVLFAAVLISAGLAAFVGSPAQAACPYTGCIDTNTKISAPDSVKVGKTAKIGVRVTSAGNAEPKGRVTVKVQRRNGGYSFIDSKKYSGGKVTFKATNLRPKGKYLVTAIFKKKDGSRWNSSSETTTFKVKRP